MTTTPVDLQPQPWSALLPGGELDVASAIEARRSIRKFTDQPVPEEDLRRILALAGRAPSAVNLQPWRFVVVRDAALKERLREVAFDQPQISSAPVVVALYSDMADTLAHLDEVLHPWLADGPREDYQRRIQGMFERMGPAQRETYGQAQAHIALGFLVLAARSMGYATSIMGGFDQDGVKHLLGLPAHVPVTALVAIGRAAEPGHPAHRHALERIMREAQAP